MAAAVGTLKAAVALRLVVGVELHSAAAVALWEHPLGLQLMGAVGCSPAAVAPGAAAAPVLGAASAVAGTGLALAAADWEVHSQELYGCWLHCWGRPGPAVAVGLVVADSEAGDPALAVLEVAALALASVPACRPWVVALGP